jgi:aspartate/methionine/tyrosine aminotransferase
VDFNQYAGIQRGAIAALTGPQDSVQHTIHTYRQRRDAAVAAFQAIGWPVAVPQATLYLWVKLPEAWEHRSMDFCTHLVATTGVALAPGIGFGPAGEGYVRLALVHPPEVLATAIAKMKQA